MLKISRDDVVAEARTWLDTKWVHQGRSRRGIDCAGLLVRVMGDLGLPVEDQIGYRRDPEGYDFVNHIRKQTVFATEPKPGSIGLFREATLPCHTGFFAMRNGVLTLIHAYIGLSKVIEEDFIHHLPRHLIEVRDIIGIDD